MTNGLPEGDRTPPDFHLRATQEGASLRAIGRRVLYPPLIAARSPFLSRRLKTDEFSPDKWLWGQRGNDYASHRRRVATIHDIRDQVILVAGCGTGNDLPSWVSLHPKRILATDWFNYSKAWDQLARQMTAINPGVEIDFLQADLENLSNIDDASVDVVASDAVFEHLRDLPKVLGEFQRILRPRGIVYATFGPLWFGYSGDHVSGYDHVLHGFNHLLLDPISYQAYLARMGEFNHSEHDGRTWISENLFSRLRPVEYLENLRQAGFERLHVQAVVDPRAVTCMRDPQLGPRLIAQYSQLDLVISGMTVIYRKT